LQCGIHQSYAGRFHWCLVGDDGAKLAVSARAFGYARDAQLAADVRLHAGSAAGTEEL
jgi:hypothetical protein